MSSLLRLICVLLIELVKVRNKIIVRLRKKIITRYTLKYVHLKNVFWKLNCLVNLLLHKKGNIIACITQRQVSLKMVPPQGSHILPTCRDKRFSRISEVIGESFYFKPSSMIWWVKHKTKNLEYWFSSHTSKSM